MRLKKPIFAFICVALLLIQLQAQDIKAIATNIKATVIAYPAIDSLENAGNISPLHRTFFFVEITKEEIERPLMKLLI